MILEIGNTNGFLVDTTEMADVFRDSSLTKYNAVVFLNTTGDVLDSLQQGAFERYIRSGKGFVGIHSAADTEYQWPWYGKLVGAYFKSHPKVQRALYLKVGSSNLVASLPDRWYRTEEIYSFQAPPQGVELLYNVAANSYEGGESEADHAVAWYHAYDGGRAFYTAMGHTNESYTDSQFQAHIIQGINYAIGDR